jgi:hypothetical protein
LSSSEDHFEHARYDEQPDNKDDGDYPEQNFHFLSLRGQAGPKSALVCLA